MNRRLYRSPDDRILAGVAGEMAETYDFDPALVRVGWALLILVTGGAFFLARQFIPAFNWGLIWPLLIVAGGLLLIVVAFGRTRSES